MANSSRSFIRLSLLCGSLAALQCSPGAAEAPAAAEPRGAYELSRWSEGSLYRAIVFGTDGRYAADLSACRLECRETGTYGYAGEVAELRADGGRVRRLKLGPQTQPTALQVQARLAPADNGGNGSLLGAADSAPLLVDSRQTLLGFDASALRASETPTAPGVDVGTFAGVTGKKYCGTNATASTDCAGDGNQDPTTLRCTNDHRCTVGDSEQPAAGDLVLAPSSIAELRGLANTFAPRKLVVAMTESVPLARFAGEMWCLVSDVNRRRGLTGTGAVKVTLGLPDGPDGRVLKRVRLAATERCKGAAADADLEIFASHAPSYFTQDFGEFVTIRRANGATPELALLDVNVANSGDFVASYSKAFNVPIIKRDGLSSLLKSVATNGDLGGNLEATPNGVLYAGDTISEDLRTKLSAVNGGSGALGAMPSTWLRVGHVDEYTSILPAKTSCGFTIVHADIPGALAAVLEATAEEFKAMSSARRRRCDNIGYGCYEEDAGKPTFEEMLTHNLPLLTSEKLADSVRYFLRGNAAPAKFTIDAFDLTRTPRKDQYSIKSSTSNDDVYAYLGSDTYVYENLLLYRDKILPGVAALVAASRATCAPSDLLTPVPTLFRLAYSATKEAPRQTIADLPGAANMVSLYDTAIVPESDFAPFNRRIRTALEARGLNVQFIDTSPQHFYNGEVHCGTQVVRDPTTQVAF